jgi:hypothetical protein
MTTRRLRHVSNRRRQDRRIRLQLGVLSALAAAGAVLFWPIAYEAGRLASPLHSAFGFIGLVEVALAMLAFGGAAVVLFAPEAR